MDRDMKLMILALLIILLILGVVYGGIDYATCKAKTKDIGFAMRWDILGSCRIQVSPNQWIPLESYYFKQE